MKNKEYLIWEETTPRGYFKVWIYENSIRVAERGFYSLDLLLTDAARWSVQNPHGYIGFQPLVGATLQLTIKQ